MASGIKDKVAILGMGCSKFGERWDVSPDDLMVEAYIEALDDAGIEPNQLDAAWFSHHIDDIGAGKGGTPMSIALRLPNISVTRVENYCASGSEAFRGAVYAVAAGAADIAIALGMEKLKDTGYGGLPATNYGTFGPQIGPSGSAPGNFAQLASAYRAKHGVSAEDMKRAIAHVSVKSHANGAKNPKAHLQKEVTEELRRKAKTINFGIIYGISAFGLANQLEISNSEAKLYIEKYFQQYPGIKNYMQNTVEFCRENGFVQTLFGRRIYIPFINEKSGIRKNFAERSAINAPIQGGAADMIKKAMNKIDTFIYENKLETKMLIQVHDELIFEIPEPELDEVPKKIAKIMENAFSPTLSFSVPLIADIGTGLDWSQAH